MGVWRKVLYGASSTGDSQSNINAEDIALDPIQGKFLRYNGSILEWAGLEQGGEVSMSRIALGGENYDTSNLAPFAWRYDINNPALREVSIESISIDTSNWASGSNSLIAISFANTWSPTNPEQPIEHEAVELSITVPANTNNPNVTVSLTNAGRYSDELEITAVNITDLGSASSGTLTVSDVSIAWTDLKLLDGLEVLDNNNNPILAHQYDIIWAKGNSTDTSQNNNLEAKTPHNFQTNELVFIDDKDSSYKGAYIVEKLTDYFCVLRNVSNALSEEGLSNNLQIPLSDGTPNTSSLSGPHYYQPEDSTLEGWHLGKTYGPFNLTNTSTTYKTFSIGNVAGIKVGDLVSIASTGSVWIPYTAGGVQAISEINTDTNQITLSSGAYGFGFSTAVYFHISPVWGPLTDIRQSSSTGGLKWLQHAGLIQFRGTTNQIGVTLNSEKDNSGAGDDFPSNMYAFNLSLEQDIHTSAVPTFAGLDLNGTGSIEIQAGKEIRFDRMSQGGALHTDTAYIKGSSNNIELYTPKSNAKVIVKHNLDVDNNLTVSGNLTVNGDTTTVSTTNMVVQDKLIELANGTTGTPSGDSGIIIERGDSNNAAFVWDESEDRFKIGTGSVTGSTPGDLTLTLGTLNSNLVGDVTSANTKASSLLESGATDSESHKIVLNYNTSVSNETHRLALEVREGASLDNSDLNWVYDGRTYYGNFSKPRLLIGGYDVDNKTGDIASSEGASSINPKSFLHLNPETYDSNSQSWEKESNSTTGIIFNSNSSSRHTSIGAVGNDLLLNAISLSSESDTHNATNIGTGNKVIVTAKGGMTIQQAEHASSYGKIPGTFSKSSRSVHFTDRGSSIPGAVEIPAYLASNANDNGYHGGSLSIHDASGDTFKIEVGRYSDTGGLGANQTWRMPNFPANDNKVLGISSIDGSTVYLSWVDGGSSSYSLPLSTSSARGGIKIGYAENGKNYPLELDANEKAYVNVPWTDDNTTYTIGCADGDNTDEEKIVLTGSDSSSDEVVLEAGTGLTIARSSDKITFTNTVEDTTYSLVSTSADGLAPQLPASHGGKFLKGDGTWEVPPIRDISDAIDSDNSTQAASSKAVKTVATTMRHIMNTAWHETYNAKRYVPLNQTGVLKASLTGGQPSQSNPYPHYNEITSFVVPYDGYLERAVYRAAGEAGTTKIGLHISETNTETPPSTATCQVTVYCGDDDTPYDFDFVNDKDSGFATDSHEFNAGDIIAVSWDPSSYGSGDSNLTLVFVFDPTQTV